MSWLTEQRRAWLYRVLVAASAVAVGYGVLTTEEAGLWLAFAAAALIGNGLATANTSTKPAPPQPVKRVRKRT